MKVGEVGLMTGGGGQGPIREEEASGMWGETVGAERKGIPGVKAAGGRGRVA